MITNKYRNAFESGQRTSKRSAYTSMKSLLVDEISKETVYAKRAPGVIAKLMGLDGMPSQQISYKQPKRSSDGFHQKTRSAGSLQHQQACNNQSCKKIARERYKDVYEVREFSTVEKLHDSKEIYSGTKASNPNNYLFQKFLREPDSLLAKHLQNLHTSRESHCKHVRCLKEKNKLSSNLNGIGHTHKKASNKIDYSFSHEFQAGLHHQVSRKGRKASDLDKSTNIVLLKPNIEVSRKTAKFSASNCELLSDGNKMLPTLDISSRKSRESKELAKEITRQMRKKYVSLSGFRGYAEPSVSKEAKKRLSERWKMSHRSEEFRLGVKGSTLGQMLSFHDTDMRLPSLGGKLTQERPSSSLDRNTKLLGAIKPLGISSSKDGWMDSSIGNSETCFRNDTKERFLIPKEGYLNGRNGRNKGVKKALKKEERRKGKKSITEAKIPCRLDDSETSELILSQAIDDSSSIGLQGSTQYRDAQPEPQVGSNKEANHPSPVSVLDTPSVEDLSSSSECFERVSAELHGLRMQLQLLKMETGASSTLISSDEDEGNLSAGSNNWEASYMADMLADYEFDDNNPNSFMATWHSPESPVAPHVFENLEKKYSFPVTSSSRSDRRLLFDYINSSILEINQLVKPNNKAWFEAELCKSLEFAMKLEKEETVDGEVVVLQSKNKWMNLGEFIEDLGCDIGNMLLDELVSEVLAI